MVQGVFHSHLADPALVVIRGGIDEFHVFVPAAGDHPLVIQLEAEAAVPIPVHLGIVGPVRGARIGLRLVVAPPGIGQKMRAVAAVIIAHFVVSVGADRAGQAALAVVFEGVFIAAFAVFAGALVDAFDRQTGVVVLVGRGGRAHLGPGLIAVRHVERGLGLVPTVGGAGLGRIEGVIGQCAGGQQQNRGQKHDGTCQQFFHGARSFPLRYLYYTTIFFLCKRKRRREPCSRRLFHIFQWKNRCFLLLK